MNKTDDYCHPQCFPLKKRNFHYNVCVCVGVIGLFSQNGLSQEKMQSRNAITPSGLSLEKTPTDAKILK